MLKRLGAVALWASVMVALSACQTTNMEPVPARIVDPDADSRAALTSAVSDALDGMDVILAPDALTDSSRLVLERSRPMDRNALQRDGRMLERPEHFQLQLLAGACILVHEGSGQQQMLADTRCEPE